MLMREGAWTNNMALFLCFFSLKKLKAFSCCLAAVQATPIDRQQGSQMLEHRDQATRRHVRSFLQLRPVGQTLELICT